MLFQLIQKKFRGNVNCLRNQIECKHLGGGYVNNFSTENYAKYIKSKNNKKIKLCRDHSGPFLSDQEKGMSLKNSIERTKMSLSTDISSGFSMLHIDTSKVQRKKYDIAEELFDYCNQLAEDKKSSIEFEFGSEDHGIRISINDFQRFKFSKIKFKILICQTDH